MQRGEPRRTPRYRFLNHRVPYDQHWPPEVWVKTGAGQPLPDGHALTERRAEVEEQLLQNLLRMNLQRASKG